MWKSYCSLCMYQIYGKYCNHVWHRNWNLCAIQEVIFCCLFVWFCGVFPFSLLLLMVPLKIIYYSLQINVCDCNVNEWVAQVKQTYYFWRMSHSYHVCTSCYNTRVWNFELENYWMHLDTTYWSYSCFSSEPCCRVQGHSEATPSHRARYYLHLLFLLLRHCPWYSLKPWYNHPPPPERSDFCLLLWHRN